MKPFPKEVGSQLPIGVRVFVQQSQRHVHRLIVTAAGYAVLDFDGRWADQARNVRGKYHVFPSKDVLEVIEQVRKKRRDLIGKVQTVVVDSGTTVLDISLAEGGSK